MATKAAAASTHAIATEAATQAFFVEAQETPANAIDAVLAGVLALAARHPAVLLSSGTLLLGGTGEGQLAIDARARQPGLSAPRPRGFTDAKDIPDAARIAAPLLPTALTFAHAGRGVRTRTSLLNIALGVAKGAAKLDDARVESLRGFGREGGGILRGGLVRDALLGAAARSLGGTLTREDLDALRAESVNAKVTTLGARRWALAPWAEEEVTTPDGELAIVAACDVHGAVAIASVLIPTITIALPDVGLAVPLLARPVLRGVTREPAGAPLALPSSIGVARVGAPSREERGVDLALGVGAPDARFLEVAEAASDTAVALEDALSRAGDHRAAAVLIDSKGRGRALTHGVR